MATRGRAIARSARRRWPAACICTATRATTIVAQITKPRMGVMPTWSARLDPATIKSLALYVHSLGGGE